MPSWLALLAALLLGVSGASLAAAPAFPWVSGDIAPPVAGIHLGDSLDRIKELLGEPVEKQKLGDYQESLRSRSRGVTVAWATADGAAVIFLDTREAGDIGGIRIGDTREEVLARWGAPSTVKDRTAMYLAGSWGVVLKLDELNRVSQLYLGRLAR